MMKHWKEGVKAPSDKNEFNWRRIWNRITLHYFFVIEVRELKVPIRDCFYQTIVFGCTSEKPLTKEEWRTNKTFSPHFLTEKYRHHPRFDYWDDSPFTFEPWLWRVSKTSSEAMFRAKEWIEFLEDEFFAEDGSSLIDTRSKYLDLGITLYGLDDNPEATWNDFYERAKEMEVVAEKLDLIEIDTQTDSTVCILATKKDDYLYINALEKDNWHAGEKRYRIRTKEEFKNMIIESMEALVKK